MSKPWDASMRSLIRANHQAFVNLVLPRARFIGERPEKLETCPLEMDSLLDIIIDDQKMILHLEFQAYYDSFMPIRLLKYNVLARSEYELPVLSCVIYLFKDRQKQRSPLRWWIPTGHNILDFYYRSIELYKLTPKEILETGHSNLLPLLPLTKGGTEQRAIMNMFERLESVHDEELNKIAFLFALHNLAHKGETEVAWLERRYQHMYEVLLESPLYEHILKKGLDRGIQQGKQEGIQASRQAIVSVVQERFPGLVQLAEQQTAMINDLTHLQWLTVKVSVAANQEDARHYLLATNPATNVNH